jgi:hypothetical protein
MRPMEHSTASRQPATDRSGVGQHRRQADADTDEPYIPHFRSLITPGVASGPILPEWLRKLFRRTDTHTSR